MKISEHVHAVKVPFEIILPSGVIVPRFVYIYMLYGSKITLIDSGVKGAEKIIFEYLKKTNRTVDEIERIIFTHAHPDHIGSGAAVKDVTGCNTAAHKEAARWIEDIDLQFKERPVPGFDALVGGAINIDHLLEGGETLKVGEDLELDVIYTPGHSRGSISLYFKKEKILFSGDVIPVAGGLPVYDDVKALVKSIKTIKNHKNINTLLSSWCDPVSGDDVPKLIEEGLRYMETIHDVVIKESKNNEGMELCRKVVSELGLPLLAANPLVARSFEANLKAGELL